MDLDLKIPCHMDGSRSRDLGLKIQCHMAGSMSGYFLIMDDMSPDYGTAMKSQWMTDIMVVTNNSL